MSVASTTVYRNGNLYYSINIDTVTVNNNYSATQTQVTFAGNIYFYDASYWGVRLTGYVKDSNGSWLQISSQTGYTTYSFSYCCNITGATLLSKKGGSYASQIKFVATSEMVDGYGGVTETGECIYDITISSLQSFNITYNANTGNASSTPTAQTKYYGLTLTLATKIPTKNGENITKKAVFNFNDNSTPITTATVTKSVNYTFTKWNINANGSGTNYNPGANYTANAATTLYAQWQANNNTFPVTLPTASRAGYNLLGWYTAKDWGSKVGNAAQTYNIPTTVTITTLYAHWNKISLHQIDSNDIVDRVSTFGGTNLLRATANLALPEISCGSANFTSGMIGGYNSPVNAFTLESYDDSSNSLVLTETATGNRGAAWCCDPGVIKFGEIYTFSCWLKPSVAVTAHMHTGWRNGSATAAYTGWTSAGSTSIPANTWTRYILTFQPANTAQLTWEYQIGMCFTGQTDGVTCRFAHAKLEKGNKPTDWTPALQDLVTYDSTDQSLVFFQ